MTRAAEMYYRITEGIRVTVNPFYLTEHSDAEEPRHVYLYRIRIENVGTQPAQLLWRHWHIHDPVGGDAEVEGEGVVGLQPLVPPGGVHEYESFCVLQAPEGHMEGSYQFRRSDGTLFDVAIPRFQLRRATA
jgi:ApaG protein